VPTHADRRVLVGRETFDDAGVFVLRDDLALVQTVDFFAPIVDDPYTFGQIAAANALCDVFAMGGEPLTALAIVGFPAGKLPPSVLSEILRGGQDKVREAGAVLIGGHSIIVSAVPMPHPRFDALRCLRETLDALTGDRVPSTAARHERLAATVACKAAIKAGDTLSPAEMQALYIGLAATTLPAHDVHGRSTIVQITWDELDRRFGRK